MGRLTGKYKVAVKRLATVEASRTRSNQHELNGSEALKFALGSEPRIGFEARWITLVDTLTPVMREHTCSWYDSRARDETRSPEWRLYYHGDPDILPGDLLVMIVREADEEVVLIAARGGSTWERQLVALFGAPAEKTGTFAVGTFESIPDEYVAAAQDLFELLGWVESVVELEPNDLEMLFTKFGKKFPTGRKFSDFARSLCAADMSDPDVTLMAWWKREEALFLALEESELGERLQRAPQFTGVDDFMRCSLSFQNRRKSRAGQALENHMEELLRRNGVRYARGVRTEGGRKPDFILPGEKEYRDTDFPTELLTMLAAKTSCKDRWRQILNEAARVQRKHLLTLEPAISTSQLQEMHEEKVQLVVPRSLLHTFDPPRDMSLLSVAVFLQDAKAKQTRVK